MLKSETTLRISFITRIQLFLWEAVIQGVDFIRQVCDGLKRRRSLRFKFPKLTRLQAGFLALFLAAGALSGLATGVTLACLVLVK